MTIKARPTVYAGIPMRSRLEADFARWLDSHGTTWTYEPRCYAGPGGQWLPDFEIADAGGGVQCLIEVKPESLDEIDPVLTRMSTAWLSAPDALLVLVLWEYGTEHGGEIHEIHGRRGFWTFVWSEGARTVGQMPWFGMGQLRKAAVSVAAETGGAR